MHHPKLYKKFHYIHHKSIYPTPFAAFSFNATEAIVESTVFILIAMIIPVHISVLIIFTLFSLIMNVYGHMGMDVLPEKVQESWPLKYINHPTHHAWHHRHFNGNYGLYLKMWDKIMGTWKGKLQIKK
jgi:lathosterol oxidase